MNDSDRVDMVNSGILTGWDANTGNAGSGNYDDWFYTDPLVIGNGTFDFFTGTNCCIDTMHSPVSITLTGVPPGTGPGDQEHLMLCHFQQQHLCLLLHY
jgi:hypothetical protein